MVQENDVAMSHTDSKETTTSSAAPSTTDNHDNSNSNNSTQSARARRRAAAKQRQKELRAKEAQFAASYSKQQDDEQSQQNSSTAMSDDTAPPALEKVHSEQAEGSTALISADSKSNTTDYIVESPDIDFSHPAFAEMKRIYEFFITPRAENAAVTEEEKEGDDSKESKSDEGSAEERNAALLAAAAAGQLSRKQLKLQSRLSIAELKQLVARPDVVELHDANSADPKLLVALKAYRNSVPVPLHWSQKRKFLQNKRGYEKPPFELPANIANTGISKIRGAQQEKEADKKIKQKMRERMQPKMGKIDIDYQILHDAFFRYQTKPRMTAHGELYHEGKEFELKVTEKKPCVYSEELRKALGMSSEPTAPPPWLFSMQRIGPPPSYPTLPIPGVTAPLPAGARWGFAEGEWGKPPLDETGKPRFGDVFGTERKESDHFKVDTTLWGQLLPEEEQEEEAEEEEEKEEEEEDVDMSGTMTGISSTMTGLTTPETLQLRKDMSGTGTETPGTVHRPLYTVLEEKSAAVSDKSLFGTSHTYVVPSGADALAAAAATGASEQERAIAARAASLRSEVAVALNPEELENLDAASLKRKYEARLEAEREEQPGSAFDDDEPKKKKKKTGSKDSKNKAYKDFKF